MFDMGAGTMTACVRTQSVMKGITSVIIVNHNSGQLLRHCVESIEKFTDDYEIIVVDNASIDDSLSGLDRHPAIRIIRNQANLGFSKANNLGIREAQGKYIMLLNSDTLVTAGWLAK